MFQIWGSFKLRSTRFLSFLVNNHIMQVCKLLFQVLWIYCRDLENNFGGLEVPICCQSRIFFGCSRPVLLAKVNSKPIFIIYAIENVAQDTSEALQGFEIYIIRVQKSNWTKNENFVALKSTKVGDFRPDFYVVLVGNPFL